MAAGSGPKKEQQEQQEQLVAQPSESWLPEPSWSEQGQCESEVAEQEDFSKRMPQKGPPAEEVA